MKGFQDAGHVYDDRVMTITERITTAYHEAGHAVIAHLLGYKVKTVESTLVQVEYPTPIDPHKRVQVALAGALAECILHAKGFELGMMWGNPIIHWHNWSPKGDWENIRAYRSVIDVRRSTRDTVGK